MPQMTSLSQDTALDPVDYAVISQGLIAAAQEMGVKLIRSAYSPIIRDVGDASAAILDRDGNVVAQAELCPIHLGPMAASFKPCTDLYPVDALAKGDFYINNDPFRGGQHLQDVYIYSPIFVDGEVVAFAGTVAHHLDLGGGNAGINNAAADVHAEGIIFPPSKYNFDRDWNGGPLERLVTANIRVPVQTIGDLNAQFAANAVGTRRVQQLFEKYGADVVKSTMNELLNYSEMRFRAAVAEIPDGVYFGEDAVDDDGVHDEPLVVKAAVKITGGTIEINFDGTCKQVTRNLNCPLSSTISAAFTCVKAALTGPDVPFNEGVNRAITIAVPEGSLLNPTYPAPVRGRMVTAYRVFCAVMRALAQAVPEKVISGGHDSTTLVTLNYLGDRGYRIYLEPYCGGYGASVHRDGCDAVDSPLSNVTNAPIEAIDMDFDHFRIVENGLLPDSCGNGKFRGGLGIIRRFEILRDDVTFAMYADRFRIAPYGLFGGTDGARGRCEVERNGEIIRVRSKDSMVLKKGDILTVCTCGGAGYGKAAERAPALVRRDVKQGYLSESAARDAYPHAFG